MEKSRTYMCIDMKSFFASVECAERGLNPFETDLVVADESRGRGTICLAVTPKMKERGIRNRCRMFELPKDLRCIVAKPRMKKYIEYAAEIYGVYLDYMSKEDIYVYSIDESFIDATDYLRMYGKDARAFASFLIGEVARRTHIPATAGIGTNLYLAKVALDITAKRSKDRIGYLDEALFRETLWDHRPITDFWGIARGIAARLERKGVTTMRGVAHLPEELLYREFGVNAELLIDHAYGRESCTMQDIKNYKSKSRSISSSQVLFEDYTFEKAKLVAEEMVRSGCLEMMRRKVIAGRVCLSVGYAYGTRMPSGGSKKLPLATNLPGKILPCVQELFERTTARGVPVRKIGVGFENLCSEGSEGYDLFTDWAQVEREKKLGRVTLEIQKKFGKSALVTAADLQEGATLLMRNKLIGGHNADG